MDGVNSRGGDTTAKSQDSTNEMLDSDSETTPILVQHEKAVTGGGDSKYVYALTFFAALGGFLFGYDTGVISGAMLLLKQVFHLSSLWQELIVSVTVGGAIFGALGGGWSNDRFGRRAVLIFASIVFTGGAAIMAASYRKEVLLIGRIVVGVGIGFASMTVPVYIAEAASVNVRGRLLTTNQLFITFGQFVASVIDGIFSNQTEHGWRYMLGLAAIPSILMWIGFLFMPESPRWLIQHGRVNEARKVLVKLRGTTEVDVELNGIVRSCNEDRGKVNLSTLQMFRRVLKIYYTRRALLVGCALQAIQQLSGINTVMYYSATIIAMSGVRSQSKAIWLAAAVAGCNFFFTIPALILVEKAGRRKLTLISLAGIVTALGLMGAMFYVMKIESPHVGMMMRAGDTCSQYLDCFDCVNNELCGFCSVGPMADFANNTCLAVNSSISTGRPFFCSKSNFHGYSVNWIMNGCPTKYAWLAPLAMIYYLVTFTPGMGPMPWTINAEIYPLWARSIGNSCSTATNWVFNLLVSMTFLHLMQYLGRPMTFAAYACIAVVGWLLMFLFLPESKGKTLEEVEDLFKESPFVPCRKN